MRIAIIGRSELMYETALELSKQNYIQIVLIVTSKEAPEYKKTRDDFKALANDLGAYYIASPTLKSEEVKSQMASLTPMDIAVSINYTGIIDQETIDLFRLGVLNAHGGDLPKYRGNACQAWALINKERNIGLCVHRMVADELDSGDIIARSYLDVNIDTRIGQVYSWMEETVPLLMVSAIDNLKNNPNYLLESQSVDPKDALRCYPRLPEDGEIDWTKSAEDILHLINGSSEPFAGAFTYLNDLRVTIWRAELVEDFENWKGIPGQVCFISKGFIELLCGQGKLRVLEVEVNGERSAPDILVTSIRNRFRNIKV